MSAPTPAPGDDRPREGYYPDPSIPGYVRYWNGASWVPGTSRPAPRDGEPLAPPPGARPAAPAVEETGPHFFDEDPPEWGAAEGAGGPGPADGRGAWGTGQEDSADPPSQPSGHAAHTDGTASIPPAEGPTPDAGGTFIFRRPTPGPAALQDPSTMTFRAVPGHHRPTPAGAFGQGAGGPSGTPGPGAPAFGAGPAGDGSGAAGQGARAPGAGAANPPGAPGAGGAVPGGFGAAGAAHGAAGGGGYGPGGTGAGAFGGPGAQPGPPAGGGFGAGKAAAARAAGAQAPPPPQPRAASPAATAPPVPPQAGPPHAGPLPATPDTPAAYAGPPQGVPAAPATPMTSGPGGGQASWAQQVHRLAGGADEHPVAPWKPPVEDLFQAVARRQAAARPAGLGRRFAARLIDSLAVGAVTAAAAVPLGTRAADHLQHKIEEARLSGRTVTVWLLDGTTGTSLGIVLAVLLVSGVVYEVLPTTRWGRTLGKKLCGVEVRDIEAHEPPAFGAALRRWLVYSVPGLLGIGIVGVLWCLFDRPWRQCWHDKAAHTFVAA
ncbi:RDD family protein [Streptomyces sp. TG1A-8]|uniref:RDD family protein n=1 Tax=Streptomyces sp. TG1A-8 TaxID=3051385 RepID=UPI00265B78B4|nr:RDD family protein [Streptomyces sp. TG1A-8]MDO0927507.1 RDD family protein [Streptomyces sp. TG1A-8]